LVCGSHAQSRREISLNGEWSLRYCDAGEGEERHWSSKGVAGEGAYIAQVPGDVHLDLVRAKVIEEPIFGLNAKKCEWMEEKDWWYSTNFTVDEDFIQDRVELCFEGLDTHADIWLNGCHIGRSLDAFVPWTADVTGAIRPGENLLVVRLDCGVRWARKQDLAPYIGVEGPEAVRPDEIRGLARIFLRKAQFSFRWDWSPRLLTIGIWRPVKLRSYKTLALRDVFLATHLTENGVKIKAQIEVDCFAQEEKEVVFHLQLKGSGDAVTRQLESTLAPGYNLVTTTLRVENPRLWWPNGVGEPFLHDFTCDATLDDKVIDSTSFKYGIREIELLQEPISEEEGQSFTIVVNGQKVFCNGGNWAPADCILARVTPETYEALVQEAAEANFNMFRVNGVGIYENDAFYEACDQHGIMVWQDFTFGCSPIPDDRDDFVAEVSREAQLIIKRLRNHPCLALWCGNNENQWIFRALRKQRKFYGWRVYNDLLGKLCTQLDPTRPFWPSSPYGGLDMNSQLIGNRHAWDIYLFRTDESRVYYKDFKTDRGKFISEFGFLAPPVMGSLKHFLPANETYYASPSWDFHNNTLEREVVRYALKVHFGKNVEDLPLEEYIILGQVFQAEAYRYVINHFRRRQYNTSGCLFWSFNVCWGTTSEWTIIDYYLNRLPSFYTVKRAFAPIMVSFKEEDSDLSVWLVNSTLNSQRGQLEYGWGTFDSGDLKVLDRTEVSAKANTSRKLVHLSLPRLTEEEKRNRYYWVKFKKDGEVISEDRHFLVPWKDLNLAPAKLENSRQHLGGDKYLLRIKADRFAWMVLIESDTKVKLSDNYFDLLPGETRKVLVTGPSEAMEKLSLKTMNDVIGSM